MKEIKVYCDSCKKDVGQEVYTLEKSGVNTIGIMGDNRTPFDLCHDCFDILCFKMKIMSLEKFPNFKN